MQEIFAAAVDSQLVWGVIGLVLTAIAFSGKLSVHAANTLLIAAWLIACFGIYRNGLIRDWYSMVGIWLFLGSTLAFLAAWLQPPLPTKSDAAPNPQIDRLEFLLERERSVGTAKFLIKLNRPYTPDELGHFRILLEIIQLGVGDPAPTLWLAGRDAYPIWQNDKQTVKLDGSQSIVWSRNPDVKLQDTLIGAAVGPKMSEILVFGSIDRRGPFQTVSSFDGKWLNVFIAETLIDKVAYFGFAVDNYLLAGFPINCFEQVKAKPTFEWPKPLTESEQAIGWIELLPQRYWPNDDSRPPLRPPLLLDFSKFTPAKLQPTNELRGWPSLTVPDCDLSKLYPPS